MHPFRRAIATAVIAAAAPLLAAGQSAPEETGLPDGSAVTSPDAPGSGCGCRDAQQPPWHASVAGPACGPTCHHCGVFHADPCGQLRAKHEAYRNGLCLPPCFPRLHTWWAEGFMPTPRPLAMPRCHRCGAVIEGGF